MAAGESLSDLRSLSSLEKFARAPIGTLLLITASAAETSAIISGATASDDTNPDAAASSVETLKRRIASLTCDSVAIVESEILARDSVIRMMASSCLFFGFSFLISGVGELESKKEGRRRNADLTVIGMTDLLDPETWERIVT